MTEPSALRVAFPVFGDPAAVKALFSALAAAIKATRAVSKTGEGQGYRYAKAKDVIAEADRVLGDVDIAVVPISASIDARGAAEGKSGPRTIFALTMGFLVTHPEGAYFVGEMTLGIGTNLNPGPPQATSSALTGCERDFYRSLLRMPRTDEDDPDDPSNTRERAGRREDEDRPPAKPSVNVPTTASKLSRVLPQIERIADADGYARAVAAFTGATETRGMPLGGDDVETCGYTDAEFAQVKAAFAAAKARVGA